jgi:hypothetical protein
MATRDSRSFDPEEALDRLLERAQWPEPPSERIDRLRASWWRFTGGRVRGAGSAWGLMALAAGLLLAAGAACWRWVLPARENGAAGGPVIASVAVPLDDKTARVAERDSALRYGAPGVASAWVRAPNRFEQTLMLSAGWPLGGRRWANNSAAQAIAPATTTSLTTTLAAALHRWVLDQESMIARVCAARPSCEADLLRWLANPAATVESDVAAIRLLALVGSPRSIPPLVQLSRHRAFHGPAVLALARLAGSEAAVQLAVQEPNADLRRRLWAEALRRASPEIVARYLNSVEQGDSAALAAAGDAQHPPLEFLFCALESPRVAQRLAAARALGRVKNPAVARRLGHYVLENVSRHEALVALLARRDRFAADFIEQARDDLRLMAVVEAAEGQLNSFANQAWR